MVVGARDESLHRDKDGPASKTAVASEERNYSSASSNDAQLHRKTSTRRKLKKAALSLVHPSRLSNSSSKEKPPLNHVRLDAAFNPSRAEEEMATDNGKAAGIAARSRTAVTDGVKFAKNPKKALQDKIKQSATSRFTPFRQSYASKADELKTLDAQENTHSDNVGLRGEAGSKDLGERLEERRDSIRTAWITSHMRRIRVVREQPLSLPTWGSCSYGVDKQGKARTDWLKWSGRLALYLTQSFTPLYIDSCEELPYDLVSMRTHLERIILASSHWQAWVMNVRSVYRWEDPKRTARWLALYFVLWYMSHIMTFLWSYIIYLAISNRFKERTVENVRKAAQRAMDRERTAYQLGELIDQVGQEDALEGLLRDLGPYAQLQMDDMANALEVLYNFYAWKAPQKTFWTLCFFASCLALCLFSDTEYCMKIIWFILGANFFFCWPVSSNYPQYRLLVSPLKWVFWGIPSHANLSFILLRKHAELHRKELIQERQDREYKEQTSNSPYRFGEQHSDPHQRHGDRSETSSDDNDSDWESAISATEHTSEGDLLEFHAYSESLSGRLYISSEGVRFERNHPREQLWEIPWEDLDEIWKAGLHGHRKVTMHGLYDSGILQFKSRDGQIHTLDPIKHRDEAFNCLIGFSRLQWQVVQTEPGKGRRPRESS